MRPYIENGEVILHAPLPHPERMAVHVGEATGCDIRLDPPSKLAKTFLAYALGMALIFCIAAVIA